MSSMSADITVARPYASAVFSQARQENDLKSWSEMLATMSAIVTDASVDEFIRNPLVSRGLLADLVLDVAGASLTETARNFVRVLAENDRLAVLPEVIVLFDRLKAEAENWVDVEIISAYPLDDAQDQQTLVRALERRFRRAVNITFHVDPDLIGGAVVRVGDVVIDGSVRAGLAQMATELRH